MSVTRRRFLVGAGGLMLALPFLPSLASRGEAGPSAAPKRFIFLFSANGQRPNNWYPQTPQSWNTVDASQYVRDTKLTGTGGISPILGPEFDALKPKLLLFRGLDAIARKGGGHNAAYPLSGYQTLPGVTVDQLLAQSSKVYPVPTPVRSVHMLVKPAFQSESSVSVANTGGILQPVPHETSVRANYDRLFGTYVDDTDPNEVKRAALRLSVVDRVKDSYDVLSKSPRLGAEDRKRLEAHIDLLADLESRLGASGAACTKPGEPDEPDASVEDDLPAITKLDIDLLVAAIKCDRTRVATLMMCSSADIRSFSYLPGGPLGEHHAFSHDACFDPAAEAILATMNNWYAKQVAYLMSQLDVVEDPTTGLTYLDNSIVYWGNEDGCNGYDAHAESAMPVLLGGSAGGALKTGRYVDFRRATGPDGMEQGEKIEYDAGGTPADVPTDFKGRPYNSLLLTILRAMGLGPSDYEQDGQTGFGDYSDDYMNQYSIADGQKPLPSV